MHDAERPHPQAGAGLLVHLAQRGLEQGLTGFDRAVDRLPPAGAAWAFEQQQFLAGVDDRDDDGCRMRRERPAAGCRDRGRTVGSHHLRS